MAILDFPQDTSQSPYVANGVTYEWDGQKWTASIEGSSGDSVSVHVGTNPPTGTPSQGDLWWQDEEARLYVYYTDNDSSQWVDASPGAGGGGGGGGGVGTLQEVTDAGNTTTNSIQLGNIDTSSFPNTTAGQKLFAGGTHNLKANASGAPAELLRLFDDNGVKTVLKSDGSASFADGNITLNADGLGEFKGGVKVTGGTTAGVDTGIYKKDPFNFGLALNGQERLQINDYAVNFNYRNPAPSAGATTNGYTFGFNPNAGQNASFYQGLRVNVNAQANSHTIDKITAFSVDQVTLNGATNFSEFTQYLATNAAVDKAQEVIGFKCELQKGGGNNFGFYAEGNAPNYFAGDVLIGSQILLGSNNTSDKTKQFTSINSSRFYSNAIDSSYNLLLTRDHDSTGGNVYVAFLNSDQGTTIGSIQTDGTNLVITGTSDYRIKTNVTPTASAVNKVKDINVVDFEYTDRAIGEVQTGFIAHELAEICPKAVVGTKDATEAIGTLRDAQGNILEEKRHRTSC